MSIEPSMPDHLVADASNWRQPPSNRWAFHNIDRILHSVEIAPEGNPVALPESFVSPNSFALKFPGEGGTLDLHQFLTGTETDALVIVHRGHVVFETYRHGMTAETPHIFMSTSKAITGLVAGALESVGALDLDAAVSSYVPEVATTAYAGATLRQLLDMRAGVILDEGQQRDYDIALSAALGDASPTLHGLLTGHGVSQAGAHGGSFRYISINTDLVGWATERATGKPFAELISEILWKPIGAEHAARIMVDREGTPWCGGGIYATARDFARVVQLLVDDGSWRERQILPKALVDDLCEGGDRQAWQEGEWGEGFSFLSRDISYRSGWYAVHSNPRLLFAMGIHGQNLFVDRANALVIVKFSSMPTPIDEQAIFLTHMAVPEFARMILENAS